MSRFKPASAHGRPLGVIDLLFNASGRLGRRLFIAVSMALLALLWLSDELPPGAGRGLAAWVLHPVLFVAAVSIVAKRLHDRGRSGWWAALVLLGFILAWPKPQRVLGWAGAGGTLAAALYLAVAPGMAGFNRFGSPPR